MLMRMACITRVRSVCMCVYDNYDLLIQMIPGNSKILIIVTTNTYSVSNIRSGVCTYLRYIMGGVYNIHSGVYVRRRCIIYAAPTVLNNGESYWLV